MHVCMMRLIYEFPVSLCHIQNSILSNPFSICPYHIFLAAKSPGRFASGLAMVMVDFPTSTALNDPNTAGLIYPEKKRKSMVVGQNQQKLVAWGILSSWRNFIYDILSLEDNDLHRLHPRSVTGPLKSCLPTSSLQLQYQTAELETNIAPE